jgi:NitT/TauT family transport system ATP-binding protein
MDEPLGALDEMNRERLQGELLRIWSDTRTTVVFVTHSISEAVFLSSRIVVMSARPGRVAANIAVDLPYPRTAKTRTLPEFFDNVTEVRQALYGAPSDRAV